MKTKYLSYLVAPLMLLVGLLFVSGNASAEGAFNTTPFGTGGGGVAFNCYTENRLCPNWQVFTSESDFVNNNTRGYGNNVVRDGKTAYTICREDLRNGGWVVAVAYTSAPRNLINPVLSPSGNSPTLNGTPAKYRNYNSLSAEQREYHVKLMTANPGENWYQVSGAKVWNQNRSQNLAFWCRGLLEDPKPTLSAASRINGQSTQSFIAEPGQTVTFTHWVGRDATHDPGEGRMQIVEPSYASGSLGGNGGERTLNNGTFNGGLSTSQIAVNFTIPSNAADGQQYCQQIRYWAPNDKGGRTNSGNWGYSNLVCVRVAAPVNCDELGVVSSISRGYTVGRTTAQKNGGTQYTNNVDPMDNASDASRRPTVGVIWAKPGDTVQFKHLLCQGAQKPVQAAVNSGGSTGGANNFSMISFTTTNPLAGRTFYGNTLPNNSTSSETTQPLGTVSGIRTFNDPNPSAVALGVTETGKTLTQKLEWGTRETTSAVSGSVRNVTVLGAANSSTSATVNVPYNYVLDPKIEPTPDVVYVDETVTIRTGTNTNTRVNDPVVEQPYSTKTKPSVYEIISFVAIPDSDKPAGYGDTTNTIDSHLTNGAELQTCDYYTPGMSLLPGTGCNLVARGTDTFNKSGSVTGYYENLPAASINIGDMPVGTKYCIALSMWPYDSHNGAAASTGATNDPSLNDNTGEGYWIHTPPKCFDIAKKPNLQIWAAGVFSKGAIRTSQSTKNLGGSIRTFGSWSEYHTVGLKSITRFGTGAAYGYEKNNGGNYLSALPGGLVDTVDACAYSKSTITNVDCGNLGNANISPQGATNIISGILARYTSPGGTQIAGDSTSLSSLDGQYATASSITISSSSIPRGKTIAIYSGGTVTISGNIVYEDGPYSDPADLPQVLIIAKEIHILPGVTNIDAWLVSGQANGGSGVVDTCYGYSVGTMSAVDCTNQLVINGPVFASSLITNRTAGAGVGNQSIVPGEIFNLRPDAYIWAGAQATKTKQASVTHVRILPPRF